MATSHVIRKRKQPLLRQSEQRSFSKPMNPLRVVYAGTPEFAVPALQALLQARHEVIAVYTQPDRPAGRGRQLTPSAVKQCALDHQLVVEQPLNFRTEESLQCLRDYRPDVMIVAAYGLILPQTVLDIPQFGCINIHASLLPRWRGAAPIQRAILAGDSQTGITLMRMEAGLDTGPMLRIASIDIGEHETAAQLHDRLATLGATLLIPLLESLSDALAHAVAQPETGVTYAKKITKDEAKVNWQQSATQIDRQVRAFNPWPVAETTLSGKQLRIWEAQVINQQQQFAAGTVMHVDANGIQVACGTGTLNITRLQLAGRNAMSAADFIKAHDMNGQVLGHPQQGH